MEHALKEDAYGNIYTFKARRENGTQNYKNKSQIRWWWLQLKFWKDKGAMSTWMFVPLNIILKICITRPIRREVYSRYYSSYTYIHEKQNWPSLWNHLYFFLHTSVCQMGPHIQKVETCFVCCTPPIYRPTTAEDRIYPFRMDPENQNPKGNHRYHKTYLVSSFSEPWLSQPEVGMCLCPWRSPSLGRTQSQTKRQPLALMPP